MGLASIQNIPDDDISFQQWAFSHAGHHTDLNRRIYELFNIAVPGYVLYPFSQADESIWEYYHQITHSNMDAVLGITGNNLLGINWKDQGELSVWIELNFSEHLQASAILGV